MQSSLIKPSRISRLSVRCDSSRSDKIREVRKQLLDVRKQYEDKRMENFKGLAESVKALAENEREFVKTLFNKVCPWKIDVTSTESTDAEEEQQPPKTDV